jgi:hypothetical protein
MTFDLHGAIESKAHDLSKTPAGADLDRARERPILGSPAGLVRTFPGGGIYCSEKTGAYAVLGDIAAKYEALGGPSGFLGYPVSDEMSAKGGRVSFFQHGALYRQNDSGFVYMVYSSSPEHAAQEGLALTESVAAVGTVAVDLSGEPGVIPVPGAVPAVVATNLAPPNPAMVGVIALTGVGGGSGTGGVINPNDGPTNAQVAQGVAGAVLQTFLDASTPGFVGTAFGMLGA